MKAVILAGGAGNRLGGETEVGPKPMVDVGGRPLLWHILNYLGHFGLTEFLIAAGHRGDVIKRYFADYGLDEHDVRFDLGSGKTTIDRPIRPPWQVDVVDTGRWTDSGGRLRRIAGHLTETFVLTFGDILSDLDLGSMVEEHRARRRLATLAVVHPPPRFGELVLEGDQVVEFSEKAIDSGWINGGIMVMEPGVLEYVDNDATALVPSVIELLAKDEELTAFRHDGFWQAMDSMRDRVLLDELSEQGSAPWMLWRRGR